MGSVHEPLRGGEFTFGVNDLRTLLALCLGLLGHGAQHGFRHVDLFDLDVDDLYAPRRCVRVKNALQAQIDFFPVRKQFVQFLLAQHGTQRGLCELRGLIHVVGNFDDRLVGIDHAQEDHGVHFERDVVARNDVLGWNLKRFLAKGNAHDAVDGRKYQNHAGTFGLLEQVAEPEDDAALILGEDLDRTQHVDGYDDDDDGDKAKG